MSDTPEPCRVRVTFRSMGKDSWSRIVIASTAREAILKAREAAEWFGVQVEGHTARVDKL